MKSLKEHKVDFVIIGATTFPVHGYARATLNIDIFVRPDRINAERVWDALKQFGYDVSDIKTKLLRFLLTLCISISCVNKGKRERGEKEKEVFFSKYKKYS
ncbi:MAG: hypothetical protein AB1414_11340 [bacterium]